MFLQWITTGFPIWNACRVEINIPMSPTKSDLGPIQAANALGVAIAVKYDREILVGWKFRFLAIHILVVDMDRARNVTGFEFLRYPRIDEQELLLIIEPVFELLAGNNFNRFGNVGYCFAQAHCRCIEQQDKDCQLPQPDAESMLPCGYDAIVHSDLLKLPSMLALHCRHRFWLGNTLISSLSADGADSAARWLQSFVAAQCCENLSARPAHIGRNCLNGEIA